MKVWVSVLGLLIVGYVLVHLATPAVTVVRKRTKLLGYACGVVALTTLGIHFLHGHPKTFLFLVILSLVSYIVFPAFKKRADDAVARGQVLSTEVKRDLDEVLKHH